jgi:hypothetical protein
VSFTSAKYVQLADKQGKVFSGGLIDSSPANLIPYKATPYARNFRTDGQGVKIRDGFTNILSYSGTGDAPFGMTPYYRTAGSRIIVGYKDDGTHFLNSINPSTYAVTQIVTGANITSDARMNFVQVGDALYCMNGVDSYGKLASGTTYTVPTSGVASFYPRFATYFNGSMFAAGVPSSRQTLYKSVTDNPDSFTAGDSDQLTLPDRIVGLSSGNQAVYVFGDTSVNMITTGSIKEISGALVYTSIPLEINESAASHETIASAGKAVYYLTKSNKIKRVTPNGTILYDVQELSHRQDKGITKTMGTLDNDQSDGFAVVVPSKNEIRWYLKTRGATHNDICISYNWEFDAFYVDTNKAFYASCLLDNLVYAVGYYEKKVYQDDVGSTDDDSPIQFEYRTKILDLGSPTDLKELWQSRLHVGINANTELTQDIYADGGLINSYATPVDSNSPVGIVSGGIGVSPIGTTPIGVVDYVDTLENVVIIKEKGELQVRARNFQFVYTCQSLAGQVYLQDLTPKLEMVDQLAFSKDN